MSADAPEILVGAVNDGLYVSVAGCANRQVCPTADRVINAYLDANAAPPRVTVDLAGADHVDSTFAGWLVGLRRRMPVAEPLTLANCSAECAESLARMGLSKLFAFAAADAPADSRAVPCTNDAEFSAVDLQLMLDAHVALMELSDENRRVFEPVVATLRRTLQHHTG